MSEPLTVALPDPFVLYRGGVLYQARIAYECWGELNAARDNAVLLFTGLSPSAHAAATPNDPSPGWWQRIVGPGLAIDTRRYFVVCVNSLGSCFGSTGAASINPSTGERYRLDFPEVAVEDIARAGYETMRGIQPERNEANSPQNSMGNHLRRRAIGASSSTVLGAQRDPAKRVGGAAQKPKTHAENSANRSRQSCSPKIARARSEKKLTSPRAIRKGHGSARSTVKMSSTGHLRPRCLLGLHERSLWS
jgi:hypothetical protein